MQTNPASTIIRLALTVAALALGGCGLVGVDMTTSPATARRGDPITFDVKLTNYSQCPVAESAAVIIPFISDNTIEAAFRSELPPDAPPEIVQYLEQLHAFLLDLCNGGTPTLPPTPNIAVGPATSAPTGVSGGCRRVPSGLDCEISAPVQGGTSGMTFPLFDNHLQCSVGEGVVRCVTHIDLPQTSTSSQAVASALDPPLTCKTAEELGAAVVDGFGFGPGSVICYLGTFPMIGGLGGGEMGEGQIVLPAHGSGTTRNIVIAMSTDAEDAGVCKGGTNKGLACTSSDDCPPSSDCGEGICVGGTNAGAGCDASTAWTDCPGMGATCKACDDVGSSTFLPLDCTTTYISPEPAPLMSMGGLLALAAILLVTGTLWLERRRER